jgi:hypothetical protein
MSAADSKLNVTYKLIKRPNKIDGKMSSSPTSERKPRIIKTGYPHVAVDPAFSWGHNMGNYIHDPGTEGMKSLILCRESKNTRKTV